MSCKVFVYGTLKRGFVNHERTVRGALSIRTAVTQGRLYDLPAGYPMMVAAVDVEGVTDTVHGELVEYTDEAALLPLDRLEGVTHERPHSGLYVRILQEVVTQPDGERHEAWVYVRPDSETGRAMIARATYLPNGNWQGHFRKRTE